MLSIESVMLVKTLPLEADGQARVLYYIRRIYDKSDLTCCLNCLADRQFRK